MGAEIYFFPYGNLPIKETSFYYSLPTERRFVRLKERISHRSRSHQICVGETSFISLMSSNKSEWEKTPMKRLLSHWVFVVSSHDAFPNKNTWQPVERVAGGSQRGLDLCLRLERG